MFIRRDDVTYVEYKTLELHNFVKNDLYTTILPPQNKQR